MHGVADKITTLLIWVFKFQHAKSVRSRNTGGYERYYRILVNFEYDFEKRLRDDFGLKKERVEWVTAWDLTQNKASGPPINRLLKSLFE